MLWQVAEAIQPPPGRRVDLNGILLNLTSKLDMFTQHATATKISSGSTGAIPRCPTDPPFLFHVRQAPDFPAVTPWQPQVARVRKHTAVRHAVAGAHVVAIPS